MKFRLNKKNLSLAIIAVSLGLMVFVLVDRFTPKMRDYDTVRDTVREPEYLYGICIDSLNVTGGEVGRGETLSDLLGKYGIDAATVDRLCRKSEGIFDLRSFRQGNVYNALTSADSLQKLQYFVYEHSARDYIIFCFKDSLWVRKDTKPVTTERRIATSTIESSLWNAMTSKGINPVLSIELSEIYAWTIDFFGLQPGDSFNVVYDELYIDGKSIGTGTIWGAWFDHGGKRYYAFRHEQDGIRGYWDEKGQSLKKAFLKAPLKYSRISSRFSPNRLHPVLRIRRPHLGVDYAAPKGTPVSAVADGVVVYKGWGGGGGNTLKIKHAGDLQSGYLHLSRFAKGIQKGSRVHQGQVIGYVGSTGLSTGPHLDFRIWKKGKAVDPLKMTSAPGIPINARNKAAFDRVKQELMAELESGVPRTPGTDSLPGDSLRTLKRPHEK